MYISDDILDGISDDSNNISNSDGNEKGFVDSLPPKDDPSIINNAPLNVHSVGDSILSTDDTGKFCVYISMHKFINNECI